MIRPGKLRNRIQIDALVETPDTHGEAIPSWTLQATRWGNVLPLAGKEFFNGQKVDATASHIITMRYRSTLTTSMRLVCRDQIFNIVSITNRDGMKRYQDVQCEELVGAKRELAVTNDAGTIVTNPDGATVFAEQ